MGSNSYGVRKYSREVGTGIRHSPSQTQWNQPSIQRLSSAILLNHVVQSYLAVAAPLRVPACPVPTKAVTIPSGELRADSIEFEMARGEYLFPFPFPRMNWSPFSDLELTAVCQVAARPPSDLSGLL